MKNRITAKEMEAEIDRHVRLRSGLETRSYLGMSQVAYCARAAYDRFVDGDPGLTQDSFLHRMCYVGYLFEEDVLRRLREMKIAVLDRREVVAGFDDRLRGHIDGLTRWGDLLEIKSVSMSKYRLVCQQGRALHEHYDQVQLYMRYGGDLLSKSRKAWVVYVCRETFEHKVIVCGINETRGQELEDKARRILKAIDERKRPVCECGYCK